MRTLFVLLTGLFLMQATVSLADEDDLDLDEAEMSDRLGTLEADDSVAALRAQRWNRWTCVATRPFVIRMYRGSSYYFRAQSGEGQEAKLVAQKIAKRACEFATNATCSADLSRCTVEQF